MNLSIRFRTLLYLVVIPLLAFGVFAWYLFQSSSSRELAHARATMESEAQAIRDSLSLEIATNFELLRGVVANPVSVEGVAAMAQVPGGLDNDDYRKLPAFGEFQRLLASVSSGTNVDLIYGASKGSTGLILSRDTQLPEGFDVRSRDYFQAAVAAPGTTAISTPRISAEKSDTPIIVITVARTVGSDTAPEGVIAFNYRLNKLIDIIKKQMEVRGVSLSFYDVQGLYLLWHKFPDSEYFYDPKNPYPLEKFLTESGFAGEALAGLKAELTGDGSAAYVARTAAGPVLVQSARIPGTRWGIDVSYPEAKVNQQVMAAILPPVIGFLAVFVAFQLAIFFLISRTLVKPVVGLGKNLENLAQADADLTVRIHTTARDEVGQVAHSFNTFMDKLAFLMQGVRTVVEETDVVKVEVSSSVEETSAAIEEIGANLEAISRQIEVLDNHIESNVRAIGEITNHIGSVDDQIGRQSAMVENSSTAITQMMASLEQVNATAQQRRETTNALSSLADQGKGTIEETTAAFREVEAHILEVQEMADTISEIASQTNLLSMNAAIEAAHAGDSGRGFAVVAEEIRKLADSAAASSRGITQLLQSITASVGNTGRNMELTAASFDRINTEVGETVGAFSEIERAVAGLSQGGRAIFESSRQIDEVTAHIRSGSAQIKEGTRQLTTSSAVIREVSDRVSTGMAESTVGAREIVAAMQQMVVLASKLNQIVGHLKSQFGQFRTERPA